MSELAMNTAKLLDMLPEKEQNFAYELMKRMVRAWDPDFTKLTPAEAELLQDAEAESASGEMISHDAIDWDA